MKERVKNAITTVIGTILALAGIAMWIVNKSPSMEISFSWVELVGTLLLAWVFIAAKDSLLEGITAGYFKLNKKDKQEEPVG